METPEHVIFHYRPMVCMGLGIAVGIFLSGSVSGTGLIMALCLFPLFSGIGIYFGFKGAALVAFGCAPGFPLRAPPCSGNTRPFSTPCSGA